MKDKNKKIKFVKSKLSEQKIWSHTLFSKNEDDNRTGFNIVWGKDSSSHYLDRYGKNKDKFYLYMGGSETIYKEDKLGRVRATIEPYDLKITKENAENLICILEAFLKVQEEEVA